MPEQQKPRVKTSRANAPAHDPFIERVEHWKKRVLAVFPLASLVLAIVPVLLIEGAGIVVVFNTLWASHVGRPTSPVRGTTSDTLIRSHEGEAGNRGDADSARGSCDRSRSPSLHADGYVAVHQE